MTASLANQFIVAMPSMTDPYFERTVILICQHNDDGALGVVVNQTTDLKLKDLYEHLELEHNDAPEVSQPVHYGGPCHPHRGFFLHDSGEEWVSIQVGSILGLTPARDILEAISQNTGPQKCMPLLGFAGWASGQLESEIRNNVWLSTPADNSIIFDTPLDKRWDQAASLIGIDFSTLSTEFGEA